MSKNTLGLVLALLFVFGCSTEEGVTFEEQLAIDLRIIDSFLSDNDLASEIHETGIRFNETVEGTGKSPAPGEVAVTKYTLKILGSDEVVGSSEFGESITLNNLIPGALFFMLQEMNEGGKMTIYAPSGYGFGASSNALIPANSNLVFEVELLTVVQNSEEQFSADLSVIDSYLLANEIEALEHESGIRYTVQVEGDGESPGSSDVVRVTYEGRFLSERVFDQNSSGISFSLNNLIEAWQIMIPTMKPGASITIYAPSGLCYGINGTRDGFGNVVIPSNTNLIFDIDLVAIE